MTVTGSGPGTRRLLGELRAPRRLVDEVIDELAVIAGRHGGALTRRVDAVSSGSGGGVTAFVVDFPAASRLGAFLGDPERTAACDEPGVAVVWKAAPPPRAGRAADPVTPLPRPEDPG